MKFAHMADCHIGGWRHPKMQEASMMAFVRAIDICISEEVDFVLIAGDLFNTSFPAVERLKETFIKLGDLKNAGIPLYFIPGSHDYSPSGKTMLDLLEVTGFGINVMKGDIDEEGRPVLEFTIDKKTGAKITGISGRKGGLESGLFDKLDTGSLEKEEGYKIFMFHTAITELKTKDLEMVRSMPLKWLPAGFDYYAGGHIHIIAQDTRDRGRVAYPGPIFPNSFTEFEKLGCGGFYIVEDNNPVYVKLDLKPAIGVNVECEGLTGKEAEDKAKEAFKDLDIKDAIITIRYQGMLSQGRVSDIDFPAIHRWLYERGAYFIMKNISRLSSETFRKVEVKEGSPEEIEEDVISKAAGGQFTEEMIKALMNALSLSKREDERNADYERRVLEEAMHVLGRQGRL